MPSRSARAAAVLERLAAEGTADPSHPTGAGVAERVRSRVTANRIAVVAAVVVLAAVLGALLVLDRRPLPIEERLPLAEAPSTSIDAPQPQPDDEAPEDEGSVTVHVAGAVAAPGVVELPSGSRVVDAVRSAGGLRPDADPDRVNLAAQLGDGQRIVVPAVGQEVPVEVLPSGPTGSAAVAGAGGAGGAGGSTQVAATVELNSATVEQLDTLPGVGPATAGAIVEHREREGPFGSVEELIEVRGIGEAKLEALRDLVTVAGGG